MWVAVSAFFQRNVLIVAGVLAAIGAVAAVLLGARNAGRNAERVDNLKSALKVKHEQQKAAARSPRTRDELIDELRNGKF
jgi:hypothetical protein